MLSNPYRGNSPSAARERRPVVSMRFSPPSQLRQQRNVDNLQALEKSQNEGNSLYMPYRIPAAGR